MMKILKGLLIALCVIMLINPSAQAQENDYMPTMVVKTNPLAALGGPFWITIIPLTGEYKALFEIRTAAKQSVMLGASYLGPSVVLNLDDITSDESDISGIKTSGFRAQVWYKFFLGNTSAPEGFYIGPHLSYAAATLLNKDNTSDKLSMTKLNANVVVGYQLISKNGFALDIFTGLGVKNLEYSFEGDSDEILDFEIGKSFKPAVAFGVNFGYAF